ncbi:hypothetical protein B0H13DRAFT_1899741 [Mycena leptocephala]|nr:hypothetical protein B0H13DRAFT_1899741 [Mycena leptocephala]
MAQKASSLSSKEKKESRRVTDPRTVGVGRTRCRRRLKCTDSARAGALDDSTGVEFCVKVRLAFHVEFEGGEGKFVDQPAGMRMGGSAIPPVTVAVHGLPMPATSWAKACPWTATVTGGMAEPTIPHACGLVDEFPFTTLGFYMEGEAYIIMESDASAIPQCSSTGKPVKKVREGERASEFGDEIHSDVWGLAPSLSPRPGHKLGHKLRSKTNPNTGIPRIDL